eukprot:scaffold1623_cov165-Ochromonas_danica.AAC.8
MVKSRCAGVGGGGGLPRDSTRQPFNKALSGQRLLPRLREREDREVLLCHTNPPPLRHAKCCAKFKLITQTSNSQQAAMTEREQVEQADRLG